MEVGDFLSSADVGNNAVETVSAEATRARLAEEVNRMQVQLQGEKFAELHLREDETQENILRRFLTRAGNDSTAALREIDTWARWRRDMRADDISPESIQVYVNQKEAVWRGVSRAGLRCCVVTGRHHDPLASTGQTFKQFVLKTVEDGCLRSGGEGTASHGLEESPLLAHTCRRGMLMSHIDPVAFQMTSPIIGHLQRFYGCTVGAIYIVHVNWLWWAAYTLIRPLLNLFGADKLVIIYEPKDIMQYVDESQLPEGFLSDSGEPEPVQDLIINQQLS